MVDFPYDIVPLWQWVVVVLLCSALLSALIKLIELAGDNDYILILYCAAFCFTCMVGIAMISTINADHPRVQQYFAECEKHEQYEKRLNLAYQAIAKEDAAARQLRLEQKMKQL